MNFMELIDRLSADIRGLNNASVKYMLICDR